VAALALSFREKEDEDGKLAPPGNPKPGHQR